MMHVSELNRFANKLRSGDLVLYKGIVYRVAQATKYYRSTPYSWNLFPLCKDPVVKISITRYDILDGLVKPITEDHPSYKAYMILYGK